MSIFPEQTHKQESFHMKAKCRNPSWHGSFQQKKEVSSMHLNKDFVPLLLIPLHTCVDEKRKYVQMYIEMCPLPSVKGRSHVPFLNSVFIAQTLQQYTKQGQKHQIGINQHKKKNKMKGSNFT